MAGRRHTVLYWAGLPALSLRKLQDVFAQPGTGAVTVEDPTVGVDPVRYYRIVTPAQP